MASTPGSNISNPSAGTVASGGGGDDRAQMQQTEKVMGEIAQNVFPTHKPRDGLHGLKSGLFNIGSGIATGAAALVTAPIVGAKTNGAKGFAAGVGIGLFSAVALPVTGVINGGRQMARGFANTAEAVQAQAAGKVWDSEKEKWVPFVPYNLNDEAAEVLQGGDGDESGGGGGGGGGSGSAPSRRNAQVKDMAYYDLLGVAADASAGQIKKGYYKEARKCHPDRNPDDPAAHAKFQELGEAYRILSSDQLRAYYDKYGREKEGANKGGMDSEMQMEMAKMFFAVMFGGERFEPYIGQLGLSTFVDALTQEAQAQQMKEMGGGAAGAAAEQGLGALDIDDMRATQRRREVQCALTLAARLQPFAIDGFVVVQEAHEAVPAQPADPANGRPEAVPAQKAVKRQEVLDEAAAAAFENSVDEEVAVMSKATFGEPLMHAIGHAYTAAAKKHIGYRESLLGIDGHLTSIGQKMRSNYMHLDVARKGISSLNRVQRMSEMAEEERQKRFSEPEPPSPEMLAAKRAAYDALGIKDLRGLCKQRTTGPKARGPNGSDGIDSSGCVEKSEIVDLLVEHDAYAFDVRYTGWLAWKEGGCVGAPPGPDGSVATGGGDGAGGMAGEEDMSEESKAKMENEMNNSLPVFMETMVSASLVDVEVTLKQVCKKVLKDTGVSEAVRDRRAQAMLIMGNKFLLAKGVNKAARGEVEPKSVIEGTMMKTMAKAQGQEVDDDDDFGMNAEEGDDDGDEAEEAAAAVAAVAAAEAASEEKEPPAAEFKSWNLGEAGSQPSGDGDAADDDYKAPDAKDL